MHPDASRSSFHVELFFLGRKMHPVTLVLESMDASGDPNNFFIGHQMHPVALKVESPETSGESKTRETGCIQ